MNKENNIIKIRKNKENKVKKFIIIILLIMMDLFGYVTLSQAETIQTANIHAIGDCGSLLKYKGIPVKVNYVEYVKDNIHYPAYCMDKTKRGADTKGYDVSISETIKDVGLWRRIINGYPYKTIEELGVANKEEAFTATKQSIYCYVHGNQLSDYTPIGEAGIRTLNAMERIIQNANNSTETKIENVIQIQKINDDWQEDTIDKNYVSKTYQVKTNVKLENYTIMLKDKANMDLKGIKVTNQQNEEKEVFNSNEKFKILIPIKSMKEKGEISVVVKGKVKTKPILYGVAPNSSCQDYALTAATYEDGKGEIKQQYPINNTKIIIIKKDQDNEKTIEGVRFALLNEQKEIIYSDLKTDKNGKIIIENLLPGTYYLKETSTVSGYEKYNELIQVETQWNQEVTVTVHNSKEEIKKPQEKKISSQSVKRLPVTGM